jgi:hypothetical protein
MLLYGARSKYFFRGTRGSRRRRPTAAIRIQLSVFAAALTTRVLMVALGTIKRGHEAKIFC